MNFNKDGWEPKVPYPNMFTVRSRLGRCLEPSLGCPTSAPSSPPRTLARSLSTALRKHACCTSRRARTHAQRTTHARTHARKHAHTHASTHTRTHAHTHAHKHARTHTHTHRGKQPEATQVNTQITIAIHASPSMLRHPCEEAALDSPSSAIHQPALSTRAARPGARRAADARYRADQALPARPRSSGHR